MCENPYPSSTRVYRPPAISVRLSRSGVPLLSVEAPWYMWRNSRREEFMFQLASAWTACSLDIASIRVVVMEDCCFAVCCTSWKAFYIAVTFFLVSASWFSASVTRCFAWSSFLTFPVSAPAANTPASRR